MVVPEPVYSRGSGPHGRFSSRRRVDVGLPAIRYPAVMESDQLFRVCVDAMTEGMVLRDACGRIRLSNRSAQQILGLTAEQMSDEALDPFKDIVTEDGIAFSPKRHPMTLALRSGKPRHGIVMGARRKDGQLRWLMVNTQPVIQPGELKPSAVVATFVDITDQKNSERRANEQLDQIRSLNSVMQFQMRELEKANAQLEALAALDGLTGLKNHRAFHERLAEEFERAVRYQTPLSVILLDVDNFKLYNDSFGHPAGDVVLRRLAQILLENARESDLLARPRSGEPPLGNDAYGCVIARHGGEEFSVILPHTDGAGAQKVAERLRTAIERAGWDNRLITASFGVASITPGVNDPSGLIAAADKALYRSKTRGRNRVTCAPGTRQPAFRSNTVLANHRLGATA